MEAVEWGLMRELKECAVGPSRQIRRGAHGEPCVPGAEQVEAFVAVGCGGFSVSVPGILASLSGR